MPLRLGICALSVLLCACHGSVRAQTDTSGSGLRIIPLGDSITWGYGSTTNGGYRFPLFDRMESTGRPFSVVGQYSDGPAGFDKPWHEGHGGATIRNLNQQWMPSAMQTYRPDVTLLMIGTNDNWRGTGLDSPENAIANLNNLIDDIYAITPATHIFLASIPKIWDGHIGVEYQTVIDYNAQLPGVVDAWAARGRKITFVDVYPRVATNELADGVHPNDVGYQHIADAFYEALSATGYIPEPVVVLPLVACGALLLRRRA